MSRIVVLLLDHRKSPGDEMAHQKFNETHLRTS